MGSPEKGDTKGNKAMAGKETSREMTPEEYANEQSELATGWEWETVAEESGIKVSFDTYGDVFIGQYLGRVAITPDNGKDDPFELFNFRGVDLRMYSVNTSYKLDQAMREIDVDTWVRITYVKDIPSNKGNPVKDFRVDVRK